MHTYIQYDTCVQRNVHIVSLLPPKIQELTEYSQIKIFFNL